MLEKFSDKIPRRDRWNFPSISRQSCRFNENRFNYPETILGESSFSFSSSPRQHATTAIVQIIIATMDRFRNHVLELINMDASVK